MRGCAAFETIAGEAKPRRAVDPSSVSFADTFSRKGRRDAVRRHP